jgi:hypothetical protein
MLIRINLIGNFEDQKKFIETQPFDYNHLTWDDQNCIDIKYNLLEQQCSISDIKSYIKNFQRNENMIDQPIPTSYITKDFVEQVSIKSIENMASEKFYNFITGNGVLFEEYLKPKYYEGFVGTKLKYILSSSLWNLSTNVGQDSINVIVFIDENSGYPPEIGDYLYKFYHRDQSFNDLLIYKDYFYVLHSDKIVSALADNNLANFYGVNARVDTSMQVKNKSLFYDFLKSNFNNVEIIK